MKCGIIFEKYLNRRKSGEDADPSPAEKEEIIVEASDPWDTAKELFFHVNPDTNPFVFGARGLFFLIIFL